jgi:ABC-2 type transport system ATP-binding protein
MRRGLPLLLAALLTLCTGAADARDATVRSFDGTPIVTHFYPAAGLEAGRRVPTVLLGHGWGGSGSTDAEGGENDDTSGFMQVGDLRRAGWNVLTWDARGFGRSGGDAHVDSAQFEARDVMALIDYVADQPEAALDRAGDPRVGMAGSSYGGGIQLVTAPLDRRIDAIVPDIAWHSLRTSLYKDAAPKYGWGSILAVGGATAITAGAASTEPQLGSVDPNLIRAVSEAATTGQVSAQTQALFEGSEPMVERIRVPTLLTQGTVDTLFTLQEAIENYTVLRRNRVPVKMMWHCAGHGVCDWEAGERGHVERAVVRWFRRWLDGDREVDTGPRFEWLDTRGAWNGSGDYPLLPGPPLVGEGGAGTTFLISAPTQSGTNITAESSPLGASIAIGAPHGVVHAVGAPRLVLTYRGSTAQAPSAHVYAQIVHRRTQNVLGNVATPIPVFLDERERTVGRPLEAIAARIGPDDALDLQIIPGTLLYAPARATATFTVTRARIELPTGEPVPPRIARLVLGRVSRRASAAGVRRGGGRLRVRLCARGGTLRAVRLRVRDRRGRRVARSSAYSVATCRTAVLRGWRRPRPGRYTLVATGTDDDGRAVSGSRRFRLR